MNDSEINQQIKQMVQFIHQEAAEKANEIKLKADEEFNIEKLRMVEAEKARLYFGRGAFPPFVRVWRSRPGCSCAGRKCSCARFAHQARHVHTFAWRRLRSRFVQTKSRKGGGKKPILLESSNNDALPRTSG